MKLKGSATIELTNADGSKEVIKHDNMITNAVRDLFTSVGGDFAPVLKITDYNESYAEALFGGILLFDEVLNDDPDDYCIPTTKVTGYASQDAYAGIDISRGSFNKIEGGVQEDGSYKFVWDFATSQANGTIKSVALCPNKMGKIGLTFTPERNGEYYLYRELSAPYHRNGYMLVEGGKTDEISNRNFRIVAIIDDIVYAAEASNATGYGKNSVMNTGILKIYKFKLNMKSASLADNVGVARFIERYDIQMPEEFLTELRYRNNDFPVSFFFNQRDKKIIVFPCETGRTIKPDENWNYVDIDLLDSMKVKKYVFRNNIGKEISWATYSIFSDDDAMYCMFVCNDYIVARTTDYHFYVIDRNDNTNIKEVKKNGEVFVPSTSNYYQIRPLYFSGDVLCIALPVFRGMLFGHTYLLDLKTGEIIETGAAAIRTRAPINYGNLTTWGYHGPCLTFTPVINPFIMTTKNNLDSPVVKTPSQTMKITYTLTEVVETESETGGGTNA